MKFILYFLIYFLHITLYNCFEIRNISPLQIPINFSKEKEIHETILSIYLNDYEKQSEFMLYISDYNLKYDNELLEDTWKFCHDLNVIAKDWRTLDERVYSCCQKIDTTTESKFNIYNYSCPVPSFPKRDFLIDLFSDYTFPIYIKQFGNVSQESTVQEWTNTNYIIEYNQQEKMYVLLHHIIVWCIFIWMISCVTYTIMSYINKWSNQYERCFTIVHILSTIFLIYSEIIVYNQVSISFQKDVILFSIVNTFYSIFLIYIPHHHNPEDPHSVEQRVPIEDIVFQMSFKIFKHPITKQICSLFYITSFIFEILSIYFFTDFLRVEYDLQVEILVLIATIKFIFKIIFLVGFLTAIYDVHVPVQINNETGQLLQILPESHYDRVLSSFINNKKVKPMDTNNKPSLLGIYDREIKKIIPFNNTFKNGEIIGYQNVNTNYNGILWQIGKIKKNKIEIYDSANKFKIYFLNIGYGHVLIPDDIDHKKNIVVYEYINNKLVRIGRIKDKYFFQDHHFLISFITFVFKMIPDYIEDDYDVNVVEILRHTFHSFTKNIGILYGYIYWFLFSISTIMFFMYTIFHNYSNTSSCIIQIVILTVLSIFCIDSGLYIKHDYDKRDVDSNQRPMTIYRGDHNNIHIKYNKARDFTHLFNQDYTVAFNYIQEHFPTLKIEPIPDNISIINDYDNHRIYLFYDENTNLISKIPCIG